MARFANRFLLRLPGRRTPNSRELAIENELDSIAEFLGRMLGEFLTLSWLLSYGIEFEAAAIAAGKFQKKYSSMEWIVGLAGFANQLESCCYPLIELETIELETTAEGFEFPVGKTECFAIAWLPVVTDSAQFCGRPGRYKNRHCSFQPQRFHSATMFHCYASNSPYPGCMSVPR